MTISQRDLERLAGKLAGGFIPLEIIAAGNRIRAKSKIKIQRGMNVLEQRYASEVLEPLRLTRKIRGWYFERISLEIGHHRKYKPDFMIVGEPGEMQLISPTEGQAGAQRVHFAEVKGSWKAKNQRDARTRLVVSARLFPWWDFVAVTWDADARCWSVEEISP